MEFKTEAEAFSILQNPPEDHFIWIAALDYLLNQASGVTRLKMMNQFESLTPERQTEVRRRLDIYQQPRQMSRQETPDMYRRRWAQY